MARSKKRVPIYLTVDEIRAMLSKAKNLRDYTLVYLAYKAGLRCHELTSLRVEHIDFDKKILTVVRGKGEKDRQVYLDDDTLQKIRFLLNGRGEGPLFLSQKNGGEKRKVKRSTYIYDNGGEVVEKRVKYVELDPGQLNDASVERIVRNMAKRAGLRKAKPVTTHTLRHTFACLSLLAGVPITTVQIALGHSSLRTTEIYLKAIQNAEQMKKDYQAHPLPAV